MSNQPPPSGAPLRIAPPTSSATTVPFGRTWRLDIALLLVAGVLVFGAARSTQTASAAPICATPPLTGTTTINGSVNTFYPGLTTTLAAGQADTTVNVGAGIGAPTPLAVGDLAVVIQMYPSHLPPEIVTVSLMPDLQTRPVKAAGTSARRTGVRQVMVTPMIHTTAAKRVEVSSSSIETPTARRAALVDGHAVLAPTRWSSDA